jgi:hypothetical protein
MPEIVPAVLAAWVVFSVVLFWRLPGRDAALAVMIGGWAILPVAPFPASVFAEPIGSGGSMHALAVPTALLVNKATAIALGCLAGLLIFDWSSLRRVRPSKLDLPILGWCLTPVVSALANGLPAAEGLAQARYLMLTWGVPYLVGRVYLVDDESLRRLGLALVLAGLAYVPLCLIEFDTGPALYQLAYGSHPYRFDGSDRSVGHRPLVFLEHGNQLGTWMATAAVAAVWLWRSRQMPKVAGASGMIGAAGLVLICVLCQSLGSILLMSAVLIPAMAVDRTGGLRPRGVYLGAVSAVVLIAALFVASKGLDAGGLRGKVRDTFQGMGKGSFTWRLARYEENVPRALEHPLLGRAKPNWSATADRTFFDPAALGLWLFALGAYGLVGLAMMTLSIAVPVAEVLKWLPPRSWLNPSCSAVTLAAALVAMNALDALLNSVFLLPLLAAAGGIHSWSLRRFQGT